MMKMNRVLIAALTLSAVIATGCKKESARNGAETGNGTLARLIPAVSGTVSGTVHFTGKAPERIPIDMSQDPACTIGSAAPNLSEQYIVSGAKADQHLANVFIYVRSGLNGKTYAAPVTPVVLDQKGCRYTPHVIGVAVGQPVEFRNSDPTMHNIHTMPIEVAGAGGNKEIDISQAPMGQPQQAVFTHAENMMSVRCNNHPWMNAFINVADSPFFAVSDAEGHFTITGLPPGTYTLEAVHEKLGEQTATVTVTAQTTTDAAFTFPMK